MFLVHCEMMTELNERYNSCRALNAESVAAAVKRTEDVRLSVALFCVNVVDLLCTRAPRKTHR